LENEKKEEKNGNYQTKAVHLTILLHTWESPYSSQVL